ncbi:MAG TPA: hypothetical protein PLP01_04540, partial [Phycisphaerae bacterium]|nr:hypothetical protein [Phycisphaerae bacterium]
KTAADLRQLHADTMDRVACGDVDIIIIGTMPTVIEERGGLLGLVFACQDRSIRCIVPDMAVDTALEAGGTDVDAARCARRMARSRMRGRRHAGT